MGILFPAAYSGANHMFESTAHFWCFESSIISVCEVESWTQVQLRLATVSPDAAAILEEINALQPWTMSWSNVADYYSPAVFFAMARHCSREKDTVHYMHSMNWIRDVKVEYGP